jgi:NADH dehydrogenase [ubiquinone] 1 alpha subcomplex assembly factor 6
LQSYIPREARDAFIAINAFNITSAQLGDDVHPSFASAKFQFWRNAVSSALAGNPPKEPVAMLLSAVDQDLRTRSNGKSRLSNAWLNRVINTREKYLGNRPFPTLSDLEEYAEGTYSTLSYLMLSALPLHSLTADHLASHIGKATGIVAILRGLPLVAFPSPTPTHHASNAKGGPLGSPPQGAVLLPLDIMAQCGVQEEQVLRQGAEAPNLKDAVFAVATRANDHLITARDMLANIKKGLDAGHDYEYAQDIEHRDPSSISSTQRESPSAEVDRGFGVLLQAVSTSLWLERLQAVDFDVFHADLRKLHWKLPWRLTISSRRHTF